jgi:hypothetical protein
VQEQGRQNYSVQMLELLSAGQITQDVLQVLPPCFSHLSALSEQSLTRILTPCRYEAGHAPKRPAEALSQ